MAADLIQKKDFFIGQSIEKVFRDLGNGDLNGPFAEERVPSYLIQPYGQSWLKSAEYYITFLYDFRSEQKKVFDVLVVKHCCNDPYAAYWRAKGLLTVE